MKTVGIRALKQNASAVVARAAAGEILTVTDRGRPVAQLGPLASGPLERMRAAGKARQPKRSLRDLGPPAPTRSGREPLSAVLAAMRDTERF
jgi:prevent-host-death family protein